MQKQRLVVIGNGMAGVRTVEEILARGGGELFEIAIFGDEPYGNYNRILLSNVMNGSQAAEEIFLNALPWYRDNAIKLHVGVRVMRIDRVRKLVWGAGSVVEPYDKLIIATGSRAFIPPIVGMTRENGELRTGAYGFRTLDDCRAIVEKAQNVKSAAVIGGGLLGLEAARGILHHGAAVHVIHLSAALMNQQLDKPAAGMLRKSMEKLGVHVHLEKSTAEVLGDEHAITGLAFKDGTRLECEMVVVATGIKPNAELAMISGLHVERAIVVDNHMRTSDQDVYAVGECAQHRGMVYGLVAPLWEMAKVLADHITDKDRSSGYYGSKLATKLKVMGVELASMGITEPSEPEDEVVQFSEPTKGRYKKLIIRNGRLVGAIMMGDLEKVGFLMQAFDKNTALPDERLSLLFDLGGPSKKVTYDEMPAEAQVCNCNGVSKAMIGASVAAGQRSMKSVMLATRAGMGCGACKGLVSDLVGWYCGGAADEDPSANYYVPCIPMSRSELNQAVREQNLRSVSAVFDALCDGKVDPASKPALASLLSIVWKGAYVDERDARFINDRVHGNIQKDGTFSVIPEMPGGICTPDELRRIANAADKYAVPLMKLTGGQRIDLVGIARDDLPGIWRDIGMPAGYAWGKSYRTCKSCIGADYCRFGLGDSMSLATRLEGHFRGLDSPGKLKLATAGCPRNCSEALVKDLGVVAVEGGRWEIYVGGAAGAHIRKGDLLTTVDSADEVLRVSGRFIQYYREHAKYKERTYTFVERLGIERIRALVVDDSDGLVAALDRELAEAVEATYDPWLERDEPKTENQFKYALKVLG
ncbi:MAG: nitrite reductase large subunit [Myxococcaceae bacterium]|nr:nitrite reductase large subunit [Myxococcaceae bacterium]